MIRKRLVLYGFEEMKFKNVERERSASGVSFIGGWEAEVRSSSYD